MRKITCLEIFQVELKFLEMLVNIELIKSKEFNDIIGGLIWGYICYMYEENLLRLLSWPATVRIVQVSLKL